MRVSAPLTAPRTGAAGAARPLALGTGTKARCAPASALRGRLPFGKLLEHPQRSSGAAAPRRVRGRADGPSVPARNLPARLAQAPSPPLCPGGAPQPGCRQGKGGRSRARAAAASPGAAAWSSPRPSPPGHTVPLPQRLPICEVTDRFPAKRGKRQPGSGKGDGRKGAVCAASSAISALPQGEAASPAQRLPAQTFPVPRGAPEEKQTHVCQREEANAAWPLLQTSAGIWDLSRPVVSPCCLSHKV